MSNQNNNHKYDDIINLPHHVSTKRPQMSMIDRAAQFSPFAALTGYDAAIKETGRLTDERIDMDEGSLERLNRKFQLLVERMDEQPEVTFTYFKPDDRKEGGAYVTVTGSVKKVDLYERVLILRNGVNIPMDEVHAIEGEIFSALE